MKLKLLTGLILGTALTLSAQWTKTNLGGSSSIVAHNGKLFALNASQELVVSADNGSSWTDVTTDTLSGRQDFLASAGNRLYVATYNNGTAAGLVYYTTDDGNSWSLDTAGMPPLIFGGGKADVRTLMSYNGDYLVANFGGPDAYCIKKATDASWRVMADLASVDPDHYVARNDTLIAIAGNKMSFSTDNGQTFTAVATTGISSLSRTRAVFWSGSKLYVGTDLFTADVSTIYVSDDFGSTWDSLSISKYVGVDFTSSRQNVTALYVTGSDVYFALYNDKSNTTADIFLSTDGGSTFTKDTAGLTVDNFSTEQVVQFYENNGRLFSVHNNTDIHYKTISSGPMRLTNGSSVSPVDVYPNPTTGTLRFTKVFVEVELYDMTGRRHYHKTGKLHAVQVDSIAKGVYILKTKTATGKIGQARVVVQ